MQKFVVVGLSYKKANEKIRSKFSLSEKQQAVILSSAKKENSLGFIISTCNRTEIYALATDVGDVYLKWSQVTDTDMDELKAYLYILEGEEAKNHLFRVGCGLESQILGDFEITSQLKTAFTFAKQIGTTNGYLERLYNAVLKASKTVRNQTTISNGTTSVSYVTVDYIKHQIKDYKNKHILLYGLGEIGKLTIENLYKHLPSDNLSVINRTETKTKKIAEKYKITEFDHSELDEAITNTDILIVATNASQPTISKSNFTEKKDGILIFDLSIPANVSETVKELSNVKSIGLDELSKTINSTIENRKQQIPLAEKIISNHIGEFEEWASHQVFADLTKSFKQKMVDIKSNEIEYHKKKLTNPNEEHLNAISDRLIQKITSQLVTHFKNETNDDQRKVQMELIKDMFKL
jgi:glutamyl-tRNA reductase